VIEVCGVSIVNGFSPGTIPDDNETGSVDVFPFNNKPNNKSSTKIQWLPNPSTAVSTITVKISTRQRPNGKFAPTSCGALYLNDGAVAYKADPLTGKPLVDPDTGEPLPPLFGPTEPLRLAAVEDLDDPPNGIVGDGSGDEDGDGLSDWDEVYEFGTDPCNADNDGDGYTKDQGDYDDTDPAVNPDAIEVCNNIDDNCDGIIDEGVLTTYYKDEDGDGYGDASESVQACEPPTGYVVNNSDCDDTKANVNPSAVEVYNWIDDNCDNQIDEGLEVIQDPNTDLVIIGSLGGKAISTDPDSPTYGVELEIPAGVLSNDTTIKISAVPIPPIPFYIEPYLEPLNLTAIEISADYIPDNFIGYLTAPINPFLSPYPVLPTLPENLVVLAFDGAPVPETATILEFNEETNSVTFFVNQLATFSLQLLDLPPWEDPFVDEGDILVDNFEYRDPFYHGWTYSEPPYPVYGYCGTHGIFLRPATIFNTVLDLQEGSRVLDVYYPAPYPYSYPYPYPPVPIFYHDLFTPPSSENPDGEAGIRIMPPQPYPYPPPYPYPQPYTVYPVVSFDFRAPLGIEPWDIFELDVIGESDPNLADNAITVRIVPLQPPAGVNLVPVNGGMKGVQAAVTEFNPDTKEMHVTVYIDREMLDGSWHAVWVNLYEAVKSAVDVFDGIPRPNKTNWYMSRANVVAVRGQIFRLDNIMFRKAWGIVEYFDDDPDFFEMGPLYAQIFEPYSYLFIADYNVGPDNLMITDLMLDPQNFLLVQDPNDPNDSVVRYWTDLGADPNKFGEEADPNLKDLFGRDFTVDLS
jgi:hypothetical protein